jgi:hypothetical protein
VVGWRESGQAQGNLCTCYMECGGVGEAIRKPLEERLIVGLKERSSGGCNDGIAASCGTQWRQT